MRVRAAHRDSLRGEVREPEWLLIEWPKGDTEPLKYTTRSRVEKTPLNAKSLPNPLTTTGIRDPPSLLTAFTTRIDSEYVEFAGFDATK